MLKKRNLLNYAGICLIALLTFMINVPATKAINRNLTNYYGIEISADEYETFINLGFTESEIYYMTEKTYEENKDLDATLVSKNIKYYKTMYPTYGNSYSVEITKEEYDNRDDNVLRGFIQTAYRTEVSTISAVSTRYRYKLSVTWDNLPNDAYYDVIAIGFNDDVHISANTIFYYTYTISSGSTYNSFNYYDMNLESTGASFTYALPSNFIGLASTMWYDVSKDDPNSTITSLYICGDYGHAITSVTGNQAASHSVDVGGINFHSSVVTYFDEVMCCDDYASVNW